MLNVDRPEGAGEKMRRHSLSSFSNPTRLLWLCVRNNSFAPSELRTFFVACTQGSAKPPPWAKSCNRFAVENSHTAQHVSHFSPVTLEATPRTPTSPNAERFPASSN